MAKHTIKNKNVSIHSKAEQVGTDNNHYVNLRNISLHYHIEPIYNDKFI